LKKIFFLAKAAPYKQLQGGVEFVKEIPKSASGKILRRILRDQVAKEAKKPVLSKL
jgi:4-coumarate--CoA ligase